MKKFKEIVEYVNSLPVDYKAESIISLLKSDGISEKDILIAFEGQLKRQYSKDISKVSLGEFENGESALTFHLNRDGMYDALPESFFHNFTDGQLVSGEEMARDSMKMKVEEKEIRSFFMPFESQVFFQLANLATKENSVFNNIYSNLLQGLIPNFWNIDHDIPGGYRDRLIMLVPMAHQIIGNIELTQNAFEFILKEVVTIEMISSPIILETEAQKDLNGSGGLGECMLGIDFISGDMPEISGKKAAVTIGPVCNLDTNKFIDGGWVKVLFESLCNYFFPMDLIVKTSIIPQAGTESFYLSDDDPENVTFMGYNTILN